MTKIAFISDVHANYEALSAMLRRLDAVGCDAIVCLGDIVGYGASPSECISLIREREIPCVMGNHDEYATMMLDMNPSVSRLREEIRQSIAWTQSQLSTDELKWLASLRMRMEDSEFMALHSSFAHGRWAYCMNEGSFAANLSGSPASWHFVATAIPR